MASWIVLNYDQSSEKREFMKRANIRDLKVKDEVEEVFLVKYSALMSSRDGKKYLNIIFGDSTGQIEGRVWSKAEEVYKACSKGDFAKVKGKINSYQGRKQFIANSVEKVDKSEVDLDDFVVKSKFDPEVMFNSLLKIVDSLDDFYIQSLLRNILNDPEISKRLKLWQAGKSIHHAYQSGLLEHILSCTQLAVNLSSHYGVNKNFVVAGAILHDICKIYELSNGLNVDYTEEGKLVGHLVKALEVVDRFSYKIKNFPYNTKLHLKHILLSHHGHYEFGSPKEPMTREAYLLHLIDLMDSKMASLETIILGDQNSGHWSNYIKHLDRIVFTADLPHYPEELSEKQASEKRSLSQGVKSNKKNMNKDLKQNLGSLFEKIEIKPKK